MEHDERIENATDSVQAMERLNLSSRQLPIGMDNNLLKEKIWTALEQLREIKARVEGTRVDVVPPGVNEQPLQELKQLLLMHVPSSVNSAARQRFVNLIDQALADHCKKILAAVVLTCPWYAAIQKERGEQAKHNILFVIVMTDDRQFFFPASPQVKEAGGVREEGWLFVVELWHFVRFLVKGQTRYLEAALCDNGAVVYHSDEWLQLQKLLSATSVTGLRSYLEACCGQAMGSIAKKRKNGGMRLRESATIAEICEAFRLLHYAHSHFDQPLAFNCDLSSCTLPDVAKQALDKLKALYKEPDVSKRDIFDCLHIWHDQLKHKLKQCTFTDHREITSAVGRWMMITRLQGRTLKPSVAVADEFSELVQLMSNIGGPMTKLSPDQVLLVARAGSFMYGVSLPDSDVDYIVVYSDRTEAILSACSRTTEGFESRGPTKHVEYGAYEIRLFCEMLLKGSVIILEVVFVKDHSYVSAQWQELHEQKEKFVTEVGIQQFLGLIKNNFAKIHAEKHRDSNRERKLFYQIFHKLDSIRHMMAGVAPPIRVTGPVRDYIMDIRTQTLEGDLSRESILAKATRDYEALRMQLANRKRRLPENPDFKFVSDWLLRVRGDIFV